MAPVRVWITDATEFYVVCPGLSQGPRPCDVAVCLAEFLRTKAAAAIAAAAAAATAANKLTEPPVG